MTRSLFLLGFAAAIIIVVFLRRAGGRLALRLAIAPLVFLLTRWPVLVAWALGAAFWLAILVPGMQAKGLDTPGHYALAMGIALFSGGGFAFMVVGPIFMISRAFTPAPALAIESGEVVLAEHLANHFLNGESRGGKLLVTSRRLAFRPHRFNVQLATWSLPLADVDRLEREGMRILVVQARDRQEPEWIVVRSVDGLADYIRDLTNLPEEARAAAAAPRWVS